MSKCGVGVDGATGAKSDAGMGGGESFDIIGGVHR